MSKNKKSRIYNNKVEELRRRLDGRDYILALDLGVGSIGLAVVALNDNGKGVLIPANVVFSCSRIFPSSSGAADRRGYRGQRNSIRHRAKRLKWLWNVLAEKRLMLPYSNADVSNPSELRFDEETRKSNPYELRLKGLNEKLSLAELGYSLYHIANHRGSSSVLASDEDNSDKKYSDARQLTINKVRETGVKTYIELLDTYLKTVDHKFYRNRGLNPNALTPIPSRDLIENELHQLLDTQKKFYPEVLTDDYIQRIESAVLYENEMLVPEPGPCPYFPEEKKLPRIAFLNEERRIWEALNNVRYTEPYTTENGEILYNHKATLSDEARIKCFDVLMKGQKLTESSIRKIDPSLYQAEEITLQGTRKGKTEIAGFAFTQLKKSSVFNTLSENQQDRVLAEWTNAARIEQFRNLLVSEFELSEADADTLIKELPSSCSGKYAPCGKSAMKILMPYIVEDRLSYQEALATAISDGKLADSSIKRDYGHLPYYGSVVPSTTQSLMGKAWHSAFQTRVDKPGFNKPNTASEEEKFGKIANPVVHQTLNELRKLVNEVIDIFGKPKSVVIETGRDIKLGKEKREKLSKENKDRADRNKKIFDTYCVPNGLKQSKVKAFRIWEDQNKTCPYCTNIINVSQIVNGEADLDHIFPQSDIPGDPESNLVVAHKACNQSLKKDQIPYTAFFGSGMWDKIQQNATENLPYSKRLKFEMTEEQYQSWLKNNGMISRFKTDNSYISTVAREYLSVLFPDEEVLHGSVRTVRGRETSILRRAWGLQSITRDLASIYEKDPDAVEYDDTKIRIDVRHHALDAITLAYSTRGMVQQINTLSGAGYGDDIIQNLVKVPEYFAKTDITPQLQVKQFREYIQGIILNQTFVSRKIDYSENGQLLKATSYSIFGEKGNSIIYGTTKRLSAIGSTSIYGNKAKSLECDLGLSKPIIIPSWLSSEVSARLEQMNLHNKEVFEKVVNNIQPAKTSLEEENEQLQASGKKPKLINDALVLKKALTMTGGKYYILRNGLISKMYTTRHPKGIIPGNVFDTGDNFRIDLYHDKDGKLRGEVIRKIDIMNKEFIPEYQKQGFVKFESLYPYDVIEIDLKDRVPNCGKLEFTSSIKVPNSNNTRTFVVITTFTKLENNIQVYVDVLTKSNPTQEGGSFYLETSMKKYNPRKVVLSSAGLVKYVSPVLTDK